MDVRVLNAPTPSRSPIAFATVPEFVEALETLLGPETVSAGTVRYDRLREGPLRERLEAVAGGLSEFPLERLSADAEQVAFWINVFHLLVVHGVVCWPVRQSVREVRGFFRRVGYRIGGHVWTPAAVEHGVLRGNRRPPGRWRRLLPAAVARQYSVSHPDPRVLLALVRASRSGPRLRCYVPETLDSALQEVVREYLRCQTQVVASSRWVLTTPVLRWYRRDFGRSRADLLRFLLLYLGPRDQEFLRQHLLEVRLGFRQYDWTLNQAEDAAG